MLVQLVITLLVLVLFVIFSYTTARERMEDDMNSLLRIYGKELDNKILNSNRILDRLIYNNSDYDLLQSASEAERYYAAVELKSQIEEAIVYEPYVDGIVVADREYGTCLDGSNGALALAEKNSLREFALQCAQVGRAKAEWSVKEIGDRTYFYKIYVWQGRATGIFISMEHFMEVAANSEFEAMTLLLADGEGIVRGCYGKGEKTPETGVSVKQIQGNASTAGYYRLADGALTLHTYVSRGEIFSRIRMSMVGMLFVIVISVLFAGLLMRNIRREILLPMENMNENMNRIGEGDHELRITTDYTSLEFCVLRDAFNRLMDEIMGLKIVQYEKQIALQETELKAVKLQIRPHFFLNAMATISSLSMQEKNEEIGIYIDALAKNIRYMFRSGLHTVPLGEEIRHVENYFEMQELKYPACVFYNMEIPPQLEGWPLPQMLIHTIIENEYKYAVEVGNMLTILIKAEEVWQEGERMLLLEIEDDGKGYPEEVLEEFRKKQTQAARDGSRVGLWSLRRILELMYERDDLFRIANVEPHGCVNRFYIPESPLHEVKA